MQTIETEIIDMWYLDWVPYNVNAAVLDYRKGIINSEIIPPKIREEIAEVYYICRSDGLVLFQVMWRGDDQASVIHRLSVAAIISHEIKRIVGHRHVFNADSNDGASSKFPTVSIGPIEIEEIIELRAAFNMAPEYLSVSRESVIEIAMNDDILMRIMAKNIRNTERINRVAIYMMRKQYARLLDKSLSVREEVRSRRLNIKGRVLFFKKYSYGWPLALLFVMFTFYSIYHASTTVSFAKSGPDDAVVISGMVAFLQSMNRSLPYVLLSYIVLVYILVVSLKRRKILQVLTKARIYLKYGNIFNSVLDGIRGIERKKYRKSDNFSNILSILDDIISLEQKKRQQAHVQLGILFILSIQPIYTEIERIYPDIKGLLNVIHNIKSIFLK